MSPWVYSAIWESIARAQPEAPALIQGERVVSWGAFDADADRLAAALLDAGLARGAKVGAYLYNSPEYLLTYHAAFKASLTPFNVNYRYGAEELAYLLDNADAEAVVFHAEFAGLLEGLRAQLPRVKLWIAVGESGDQSPTWAIDLQALLAGAPERPSPPVRRSGDDQLIIYTGGTTGMPKGVMWRQEDLLGVGNYGANIPMSLPPLSSPDEAGVRAATLGRPVTLVACPLMHGTGLMGGIGALTSGGAAAFLPSRRFDVSELLGEVERLRASRISIVGMAFAAPLLDALDAEPDRWDLSSVRNIVSSGAMWNVENKQALLRHLPQATLSDSFASSEAFGMAISHSTAGGEVTTGRFTLSENCAVFTEDGRRVAPGSGERGIAAVGGHIPLGYYKDPEKTARTFPTLEGRRWSMPGDWATVNPDGTLNLLGRGSQCINTGGEKVFPEEVEEALKRHAAVRDAAVVGLPDARFGERICALVELKKDARAPGLEALAAHVREHLAPYKAPRALVITPDIGRAPNGKLDYGALKALATLTLGEAAR